MLKTFQSTGHSAFRLWRKTNEKKLREEKSQEVLALLSRDHCCASQLKDLEVKEGCHNNNIRGIGDALLTRSF